MPAYLTDTHRQINIKLVMLSFLLKCSSDLEESKSMQLPRNIKVTCMVWSFIYFLLYPEILHTVTHTHTHVHIHTHIFIAMYLISGNTSFGVKHLSLMFACHGIIISHTWSYSANKGRTHDINIELILQM